MINTPLSDTNCATLSVALNRNNTKSPNEKEYNSAIPALLAEDQQDCSVLRISSKLFHHTGLPTMSYYFILISLLNKNEINYSCKMRTRYRWLKYSYNMWWKTIVNEQTSWKCCSEIVTSIARLYRECIM